MKCLKNIFTKIFNYSSIKICHQFNTFVHTWSSYKIRFDTVFPYMFIYWAFNNKMEFIFNILVITKSTEIGPRYF